MKLVERARWLYRIVLLQQITRVVLRAAWLSGAVYLFCWGAHSLWGVLPHSGLWLLLSALTGVATLLTLLVKPIKLKDFLWRVDGKFSQKEQISTAYQISVEDSKSSTDKNSVAGLLIDDAAALLPAIIRSVLDIGWRLRNDVEATFIVLMLLMIVYLSGMESLTTVVPGSGLGILPGPGSDPSFLDIYGSGIPGDTTGVSGDLGVQPTGGQDPVESGGSIGGALNELEVIYRVFREMGEMLRDDAVTADFGNSLVSGDFVSAAEDLASLSENIDRTTPETRQNLAESFSFGVRELYLSEFDQISSPLASAAAALEEGGFSDMRAGLDLVSEMLRSFRVGETSVVAREELDESQPEIERMSGDGEEIALESPEDVSDLLVAPGSGAAGSGENLGEVVDLLGPTSSVEEDSSQAWYDYGWDEKDVVSKYFSPR